jgi:hypothetical protein
VVLAVGKKTDRLAPLVFKFLIYFSHVASLSLTQILNEHDKKGFP